MKTKIKVKILRTTNRDALLKEIRSRTDIPAIVADPRNTGYQITTKDGVALVTAR
jgi:hypothetical protein